MDLSLADVHAQVELRATKMGVPLPVYDDAIKKQLAYDVTEMVLDMSRMCNGSLYVCYRFRYRYCVEDASCYFQMAFDFLSPGFNL